MRYWSLSSVNVALVTAASVLTVLYLSPWRCFPGAKATSSARAQDVGRPQFFFSEMAERPPQAIKAKHDAVVERERRLKEVVEASGLLGPLPPLTLWNKDERWSVRYGHRFDPFFGFAY